MSRLHNASESGSLKLVKKYLDAGDVNIIDDKDEYVCIKYNILKLQHNISCTIVKNR